MAISDGGNFFEYISRMYATMNAGVSLVSQGIDNFALGSIDQYTVVQPVARYIVHIVN